MIFGDLGDLKLPDICLTGEEKPRKNLTQETCPDRGSTPGPLRDRRACYHLLHSGGHTHWAFVWVASLFFNKLCSLSNLSVTSLTSQPILQPFRRFTYVAAHSETLPSLHLRRSSFSNPSVASPTSQLLLQPFRRFSYVTGSSFTSSGEPPMIKTWRYVEHFADNSVVLCHEWFLSNDWL